MLAGKVLEDHNYETRESQRERERERDVRRKVGVREVREHGSLKETFRFRCSVRETTHFFRLLSGLGKLHTSSDC